MKAPDKNVFQVIAILFLLILTLPLFYLVVTRVLLPLEWKETPADAQHNTEQRAVEPD